MLRRRSRECGTCSREFNDDQCQNATASRRNFRRRISVLTCNQRRRRKPKTDWPAALSTSSPQLFIDSRCRLYIPLRAMRAAGGGARREAFETRWPANRAAATSNAHRKRRRRLADDVEVHVIVSALDPAGKTQIMECFSSSIKPKNILPRIFSFRLCALSNA